MAELKISYKAFAGRILRFAMNWLALPFLYLPVSDKSSLGDHSRQVKDAVEEFYTKYYNDTPPDGLYLEALRPGLVLPSPVSRRCEAYQDETGSVSMDVTSTGLLPVFWTRRLQNLRWALKVLFWFLYGCLPARDCQDQCEGVILKAPCYIKGNEKIHQYLTLGLGS